MDARKMNRYAAMLVTGAAGLATTLAGCGGPEPSKTAGTPTSSSSTTSSTASATTAKAANVLPATIDINSSSELASALNTLGIETPATAPIGTDRAGGAEGVAFPTWPSGDVRKEGLSTYRIDAPESYGDDGTLKFMRGNTALYEVAFKPEHVKTQAAIPQDVMRAVKAGDTITWGVYFANKKQKALTVSFKVVVKPQVAKAEAKLEGDTVAGVVRDLARAQLLKNYGFYSEALSIYTGVVDQDSRITSVYTPMADCLHSLKLVNTPLFDLAKSSMPVGIPKRLKISTEGNSGLSSTGGKGPGQQPLSSRTAPVPTPGSAAGVPATTPSTTPATTPDDATATGPADPTAPLTPGVPFVPGSLPTVPGSLPTTGLPTVPGAGDPSVPGSAPSWWNRTSAYPGLSAVGMAGSVGSHV